MDESYVKLLETRNAELTSLLEQHYDKDIIYLVEPKSGVNFSNGFDMNKKTYRVFYMNMSEAIVAYGDALQGNFITTSTADDTLVILKEKISIYEYNTRTRAKNKVFG